MKKMVIAVLSALVAAAAFPQQALYDVVIHDGMIVDGTGNPWYRADIGITGGRIQKIGGNPTFGGGKVKKTAGLAVPPGRGGHHTPPNTPALVDRTPHNTHHPGFWRAVLRENGSARA